jgi:membrane protein implicated in regulation of membrane protease activity
MDPFLWAAFGLILILSELFVPGFVVFFFGAGALLTALMAWLVPFVGGSLFLQIMIWLVFSALSLGSLRRWLAPVFRGRRFDADSGEDYVGKQAEVVEAVAPDRPGRVSHLGTTWKAVSDTESFPAGAKIVIIERNGMTLTVSKPFIEDSQS